MLNNSVTWHCLNCEAVSVVAPIYKDTLQKGCIRNESITAKDSNQINNAKCKSKSIPNSVSCGKLVTTGAMNQSSMNGFDRYNRFSHRQTDLCPVLVATNTSTGDCYVNQVKYNEVTRYRPVGGLCPLNRHLENKSLPNIVDAFKGSGGMQTQEFSEHFFGERIFTVNKPNAFTIAPATTTNHGGINSARKSLTPMHEIHKFTRFATKSAARESSVVKKMCTPGEACRMCNLGRCQNDTFAIANKNQSESPLDTSRFTITTLSRNNAVKSTDKNQTLSGNGGVLIAVRDWSMEKSSALKNYGCSAATAVPMSADNYYEILRNPNNNTTAEQSNKDCNRTAKSQTHIYENSISATKPNETNGPIYAVVNKMNKTKNIKQPAQAMKSPEQTKFTYIGMSPTANAKPIKATVATGAIETDALYASTQKNAQHNNNHSNNNNGVCLTSVMSSLNSMNNNNGVPSNDCTPPATNAEFSTKVWKGNKKPMEANKT